jgi:hypothetical protein
LTLVLALAGVIAAVLTLYGVIALLVPVPGS